MRLSEAVANLDGKLIGQDLQFQGCSTDSRSIDVGNLFIAIHGENYDGHSYVRSAMEKGAVAAMVDTAVDDDLAPIIVIEDTIRAMGLLAAYWRKGFEIPLFAITGSNGKTTVKEMLSSILGLNATVLSTKGNLNNHIGVPLTLFRLGQEHKFAVIEMGANHSGEIEWLSQLARPSVALITQCAPAHLEGFGSVDGVAEAKAEIFSGLCEYGTAIINADDKYADFWRQVAKNHRQISFALKNDADITASNIEYDYQSGKTNFLIHFPDTTVRTSISLAGEHNVQNAISAAACCVAAGIDYDDMSTGLQQMKSISSRLQMLESPQGIRLFNDTYNANPESLRAGLEVLSAYPGHRWLVMGDMLELGDESIEFHRQAGVLARQFGIDKVYGIGDLTSNTVKEFGTGAKHFESTAELITELKKDLSGQETLLIKGSRAMAMDKIVESLMAGN
jgi:UDP-N-acetylmuramoyl-tripeptide--D-alanyl-D-alanine ligase